MIDDLIERVEKGEGWDSTLDKDILRSFGFTWRGMDYWSADNKHIWKGVTCFTASLDAVVALIEAKLPVSMWASGSHDEEDMPWACVTRLDKAGCPDFTGRATSPARALLSAFLKAFKEQSRDR